MMKRKTLAIIVTGAGVMLAVALAASTACRSIDSVPASNDLPAANAAPATPAPTPTPPGEIDRGLQAEADSLAQIFDDRAAVPVYLRDEPIVKTGTETQKGVAYTICSHRRPTVFVKKVFYLKANQKQRTNILKHELTHAWFCRQGIQTGHDERFRQKFKEVGGFGN